MDIIEVKNKMEKYINELDKMRDHIKERGVKRAQSISEYRKEVAKTIIGMRMGKTYEVDGVHTVDNPQASIIIKLAQGVCWEQKLKMETCEAEWKSLMSNIETTKAMLNALQSLNKQ